MSNKLDKTNEDKHLACMFYINEISTDTQGLLEMINNRDKEDDWGQYIPHKLETAKEALREVSDIHADICKLAKQANLPKELVSNIFQASEFVRDEINSFLEEKEQQRQKAKNIMKKERQCKQHK